MNSGPAKVVCARQRASEAANALARWRTLVRIERRVIICSPGGGGQFARPTSLETSTLEGRDHTHPEGSAGIGGLRRTSARNVEWHRRSRCAWERFDIWLSSGWPARQSDVRKLDGMMSIFNSFRPSECGQGGTVRLKTAPELFSISGMIMHNLHALRPRRLCRCKSTGC